MHQHEPGSYLVLVSLGPVQDFIASARRCQDLWYGSWLLSELSRAVAREFKERYGEDALVFPGRLDEERKAAVANKILCRIPAPPDDGAEAGRQAMMRTLNRHAQQAFDVVERYDGRRGLFHRRVAEQQVADLIEYLWVAVPFSQETDYARVRFRAEQLLAIRKNTKTWDQVRHDTPGSHGGYVPKCALDGQRESVLDEKLYDRRQRGALTDEEVRRHYFVKPAERLSGIGLLKRVGTDHEPAAGSDRRPVFHSTSHVSCAAWRTRWARMGARGRDAFAEYLGVLGNLHVNLSAFSLRVPALGDPETGLLCPFAAERTPPVPSRLEADRGDNPPGYDGYLVYESRLPEVLAECSSTPEEDLERAVKTATLALRKLIDVVGGRPSTYYAVLAADGDRMGAALDELESLDEQRELSRALDDFSASCPRIARDYCGSLVYAGGDDVLALLPLHTALGCAKELHTEFSRKMEPFRARVRELPTLSVGLGIAHHMEDMADARALARQAEQLAKSYQRGDTRKNALALVVGKRSGPLLKAVGGWADDSPLDRCIDSWCRLLREERIPDRAAFDLERAVRPFEVGNGPPVDPQLVQALVNRCLLRKRAKKGSAELDQEVRTLLARAVEPQAEPIGAVRALSAELQIARLFLEAYELAFGDLELPEATPEIEQGAQP